jgi:hypothetical protein
MATRQVAFLPSLLVKPFLAREELREIRCLDIPHVERDVFMSVKSDAVPEAVFRSLGHLMSEALKD